MKKIFIIFLLSFSFSLYSQNSKVEDIVYVVVEDMPVFIKDCMEFEGEKRDKCNRESWFGYLKTIKTPNKTLKKDQKARVYMTFTVEKDGSVGSIDILRTSGNKKLDKAAIKHLKKMPNLYKAGFQKGEPVKVKYNFPIDFKG